MNFLRKSFSVMPGANEKYRDNHDRIFGARAPASSPPPNLTPAPLAESTLNCLDCGEPLEPANLAAHRCREQGEAS